MRLTIKKRIFLSFAILALAFIMNAIITIVILHKKDDLNSSIKETIHPSLVAIDDLNAMITESKMYATNWVFLRANEDDKKALRKLHAEYPLLKSRIMAISSKWQDVNQKLQLENSLKAFEISLMQQRNIIKILTRFEDYDDLSKKLEAERIIEDEVIPMSAKARNHLSIVIAGYQSLLQKEAAKLILYSNWLRSFIVLLSLIIAGIGVILSLYMTKLIVTPIHKIRSMINELAKGKVRFVETNHKNDEMALMVEAVNNLSVKLERTAKFASEVGQRNFDVPFEPLSNEDVLGKSLITMRDNLKRKEKELMATTDDLVRRNNDLLQFNYIVSHNLRGPLANIIGLTQLINMASPTSTISENQELVDSLQQSSNKLDEVIMDMNDILKTRNTTNVERENIYLENLISDITRSIQHIIIAENVQVKCDFSEVPYVTSIRGYIYSVFFNLISNSIKYKKAECSPVIEIKSSRQQDKLVLVIKDNGRGINLNLYADTIFGLYKRFDYTVEGKGMGLFMVKTQVQTLGGNISIKSEVGVGTEFTIELPLKLIEVLHASETIAITEMKERA